MLLKSLTTEEDYNLAKKWLNDIENDIILEISPIFNFIYRETKRIVKEYEENKNGTLQN